MKFSMLLCLCFFWAAANAQDCSCTGNFRYMIEKVKQNYVGYADKVTPHNRRAFVRYTDSLHQVASATGEYECLFVQRAWLRFFNDRHMMMSVNRNADNKHIIRAIFAAAEKVSMSEDDFKSYLSDNKAALDSLEGIWEDEYSSYRIAFMRDRSKPGTEFIGFILQADSMFWMPGQVKTRVQKQHNTYKVLYFYNRDHDALKPTLALNKHLFNAGICGVWHKVYPANEATVTGAANRRHDPSFKVLDSKTCLLVLPSFGMQAKPIIDSLVTTNTDVIKRSRHLIIDLRNNTGGSVLCFEKLLPILYTRPYITEGASVLATEDNIRDYYAVTDYPNVSDSMKAVFEREAKELKAHQGTLYNLWKPDTLAFNEVWPDPQRVSVIINENCASSAELFLLKARQSSKVKIYGQHSAGAVDYSDATTTKMPCGLYSLRYPTSRTNRLPKEPLDNIGIQPHVKIPANVVDWIEFVRTNSR